MGWPLEQVSSIDTELLGQPVDDFDTGSVHAPFERADIRAVDLRPVGQLLLGEPSRVPKLAQIERQHLSYLHTREKSGLWSIPPRSIFDKRIDQLGVTAGSCQRSGVENRNHVKRQAQHMTAQRSGVNRGLNRRIASADKVVDEILCKDRTGQTRPNRPHRWSFT